MFKNGSRKIERLIGGILIPVVLLGITVADFVNDGQIDKELIGALILFAFGFTGRMLDLQVWKGKKNEDQKDHSD